MFSWLRQPMQAIQPIVPAGPSPQLARFLSSSSSSSSSSLLLFVTPIRTLAIHVSGLLTAAVRPVLAPVFLLQQLLLLF